MLRRRYNPELMDDRTISNERMARALKELKLVNRYLGGKATTRQGIRLLQKTLPATQPLSILDLGAGGADVFENVSHDVRITAIDRNEAACRYIRAHTPYAAVCGDVLQWPVKDRAFDIVHASLFLHHFREHDIRSILLTSLRSARYGVVVNDLRRSIVAYAGIKLLTVLFSKSDMVRHDGPLSVLRGFSRKELTDILHSCGIRQFIMKRTWAFRWLVVVLKSSIENRQFPIASVGDGTV